MEQPLLRALSAQQKNKLYLASPLAARGRVSPAIGDSASTSSSSTLPVVHDPEIAAKVASMIPPPEIFADVPPLHLPSPPPLVTALRQLLRKIIPQSEQAELPELMKEEVDHHPVPSPPSPVASAPAVMGDAGVPVTSAPIADPISSTTVGARS